ncbi:MAG: hypothetical protein SGJ20_11335, partial [Planctomycetota bacterium]|nr:hypothetical protein [Planctomycetota bacterium]
GQQLEQTLAGVSFQRTPLIDFLTTVSQLSTIPIALDADALISRGLAVDTPVSAASQKQISVQDLCKQALTPLGLTVVPHDRYLVVTTRTEASGSRHARYAVDDLIRNGNATTKELAIGIRHLIAPDSWLGTGGEGKIDLSRDALEVDQTDVVHDQIVTLCEKLRVARGLPLRTRYDARQPALAGFNPKRYETTSRTQQAKQLLSRKVTAGVGRPAPLSVVTNYLQQQTNGIILIDVAALAEADLSALSETTLSVKDQPLDQALTQLTKPLGLTWRVLDARTIEITTPEAAAARPDCELYSVRDQQKNAETSLAFEQRLRQQLMAATKLTESELRTHYDSASQVLVVSAPAATQRLIEAELTRSRAGVK